MVSDSLFCDFKLDYKHLTFVHLYGGNFFIYFLLNTVKVCSFSCTQTGPHHVHFKFHTGVWHLCWYSKVCAALATRGTPCVLTVRTHTGLPQPLSRHSGFYSYCITAPTATTNVNCSVAYIGHSGAKNTGTQPQLSTSLFQVHHHPYLHHLTWESIFLLVVDSSHHFSLRDRNTPRPREQTPRISTTDWCWYIDKHLPPPIYQYSTCHLQSPEESPLLTQHIDDEGGSQVCGHCGHAS